MSSHPDRTTHRVASTQRAQLADSHLVYVPATVPFADVGYDVYPLGGGAQLGVVSRQGPTWTARSADGVTKIGRARWEVAVAVWGDAASTFFEPDSGLAGESTRHRDEITRTQDR